MDSTFLALLLRLEPDIRAVAEDNNTSPQGILEFWARRPDGLNAERSYTPEFPPNWPSEDYRAVGKSYGLALADALASHASDSDKNHVVDATDIVLLQSKLGSEDRRFDLDSDGGVTGGDLRILVTGRLASAFGDGNLDGRVDDLDDQQLGQLGDGAAGGQPLSVRGLDGRRLQWRLDRGRGRFQRLVGKSPFGR